MKLVQYNHEYKNLLEKYFLHTDTPINNRNHKAIKSHLYDNINGMLFLIIDKDEIVATHGVMLVTENNIISAKYPHRLHIRSDYSIHLNSIIDKFFDPALYEWLEPKNIRRVYSTVNEGNEMPLFWSSHRHSRRCIEYVGEFGKKIRLQNWYVYPKLVEEMHCWQYISYSCPDDIWWYKDRNMKDIDNSIIEKMNKHFTYVKDLGWKI